jgi:hypothetical protein
MRSDGQHADGKSRSTTKVKVNNQGQQPWSTTKIKVNVNVKVSGALRALIPQAGEPHRQPPNANRVPPQTHHRGTASTAVPP